MNKYLEKIAGKLSSVFKNHLRQSIPKEIKLETETIKHLDLGKLGFRSRADIKKADSVHYRNLSKKMKLGSMGNEGARSAAISNRIKSRVLNNLAK